MDEPPYVSRSFTAPYTFTAGVEGPACGADGNLYAVNYEREGTVGRITPEGEGSVFIKLPAGSVGNGIRFDRRGTMYVADYAGHNVLRVDVASRRVEVFAHEPRMHQPNDLTIRADGTLYASDPDWATGTGRLWRVDPSGAVTLLEDGLGTTNGIEVAPDERTLYVNESVQRTIWAYDLAPGGELSNKRLLVRFPDHGLDGMRCDVGGTLYVTRHGKGVVALVSPRGEVLREVPLAGALCTNLTFGGPDGCTCYVTVADRGNVERFRTERPGRCWALLHR